MDNMFDLHKAMDRKVWYKEFRVGYETGCKLGYEIGLRCGELSMLIELVQKGFFTEEIAAQVAGMIDEDFRELIKVKTG